MNWIWAAFPSSQRRGGRDINKNVAKPPLKERTGWSDRRNVALRRTDHSYGFALSRSRFAPVCAE